MRELYRDTLAEVCEATCREVCNRCGGSGIHSEVWSTTKSRIKIDFVLGSKFTKYMKEKMAEKKKEGICDQARSFYMTAAKEGKAANHKWAQVFEESWNVQPRCITKQVIWEHTILPGRVFSPGGAGVRCGQVAEWICAPSTSWRYPHRCARRIWCRETVGSHRKHHWPHWQPKIHSHQHARQICPPCSTQQCSLWKIFLAIRTDFRPTMGPDTLSAICVLKEGMGGSWFKTQVTKAMATKAKSATVDALKKNKWRFLWDYVLFMIPISICCPLQYMILISIYCVVFILFLLELCVWSLSVFAAFRVLVCSLSFQHCWSVYCCRYIMQVPCALINKECHQVYLILCE